MCPTEEAWIKMLWHDEAGLRGFKDPLDRLDREIRNYHEWKQNELAKFEDQSSLVLERAMSLVKNKWPDITCEATLINPVDRQLNWHSHDLCLVDDWDFPQVPPSMEDCSSSSQDSDRDSNPAKNENEMKRNVTNSGTRSECLLLTKTDAEQCQSQEDSRNNIDTTRASSSSKSPQEEGCSIDSKWPKMRIIYSSSLSRKFLLEISTNHSKQQQQQRLECGNDETGSEANRQVQSDSSSSQRQGGKDGLSQRSILCVKWSTIDEFNRDSIRSSLVFYYTQIYPDLAPLYTLLVDLLEAACLLESSTSMREAADAKRQPDRAQGDLAPGSDCLLERGSQVLDDMELARRDSRRRCIGGQSELDSSKRRYTNHDRGAEQIDGRHCIGQDHDDERGLLSGYSLVLMLVAYLANSQSIDGHCLQPDHDGDGDGDGDDDGKDSEKPSRARPTTRGNNKSKHLLSTKLIGFLSLYSKLARNDRLNRGFSIHIRPRACCIPDGGTSTVAKSALAGTELELRLEKNQSQSQVTLSILDPVPSDATRLISINDKRKFIENFTRLSSALRSSSSSSSNELDTNELTEGKLKVGEKIGKLFLQLEARLKSTSGEKGSHTSQESVLRLLFETASEFRYDSHDESGNDEEEEKQNNIITSGKLLKLGSHQCESDRNGNEKAVSRQSSVERDRDGDGDGDGDIKSKRRRKEHRTTLNSNAAVASFGGSFLSSSYPSSVAAFTWEPSSWPARLSLNRLRWRNVLTNTLYLMLFLLLRNSVLNYLENLRDDLKDEVHDDLVDFKKIIFEQHRQQQQYKASLEGRFSTTDFYSRQKQKQEAKQEQQRQQFKYQTTTPSSSGPADSVIGEEDELRHHGQEGSSASEEHSAHRSQDDNGYETSGRSKSELDNLDPLQQEVEGASESADMGKIMEVLLMQMMANQGGMDIEQMMSIMGEGGLNLNGNTPLADAGAAHQADGGDPQQKLAQFSKMFEMLAGQMGSGGGLEALLGGQGLDLGPSDGEGEEEEGEGEEELEPEEGEREEPTEDKRPKSEVYEEL